MFFIVKLCKYICEFLKVGLNCRVIYLLFIGSMDKNFMYRSYKI